MRFSGTRATNRGLYRTLGFTSVQIGTQVSEARSRFAWMNGIVSMPAIRQDHMSPVAILIGECANMPRITPRTIQPGGFRC
jgi:hypothetical protein